MAIREAMKHRSYVTPLVTEGMLGSLMQAGHETPGSHLTTRQREVLQLLAEGKSMKEVAALPECGPADCCLSQIPDDGAAQDQDQCGAHPVRDPAAYRLTACRPRASRSQRAGILASLRR